jgi:RNA polymerase sigma factor (sigma-70 family)
MSPPAPDPSAEGRAADPLPDLSRSIELVRRYQAGESAACNELFERYRPRLLRIVRVKMGALRRRLEEEDVVQEVLMVASEKLGSFELRSHAGLLQWLARIADNVVLRKRERYGAEKRDAGREVRLPRAGTESSGEVALAAGGLSPSQNALRAEFEALVDSYVEELEPREQRDVILLRDYYQEEWEDVRRALGRPTVAAVQELYRRAYQKLRERMRKHLERD